MIDTRALCYKAPTLEVLMVKLGTEGSLLFGMDFGGEQVKNRGVRKTVMILSCMSTKEWKQ